VIVTGNLETRHLDRLRHGRVHLPRHDGGSRLHLGQALAQAGVGTRGQQPQVEADLAEIDGEPAQTRRAREKRAQAPGRAHGTRRRLEPHADETGELADNQPTEARMRGERAASRRNALASARISLARGGSSWRAIKRIAVGVTSFEDCPRFTWLLGWMGR
jgi:hypothetical protein